MTEYLHAGARQFGFMLRGLRELEPRLEALNIPFFLVKVRAHLQKGLPAFVGSELTGGSELTSLGSLSERAPAAAAETQRPGVPLPDRSLAASRSHMVNRYIHRTATCSWCMLQGDPVATIPKLVKDIGAGALVTDLAVLRLGREWRTKARTAT